MIIGISGKIGSGKDTVGKIIQILTHHNHYDISKVVEHHNHYDISKVVEHHNHYDISKVVEHLRIAGPEHYISPVWKIKKFADKLKDIVCLLIGCTREMLEDREFKEKELGEEWKCYKVRSHNEKDFKLIANYKDANDYAEQVYKGVYTLVEGINLTPRLLLQLLGTECGRDIIHPNLWVLSLFVDYKSKFADKDGFITTELESATVKWKDHPTFEPSHFPNWIITDTRFPNELEAVKSREGITIRVDRFTSIKNDLVYFKNDASDSPINGIYRVLEVKKDNCTLIDDKTGYSFGAWFEEISKTHEHESETALDNAEFDYYIDNSGTIEELIQKVREILIKEKII